MGTAVSLSNLGNVDLFQGEHAQARALIEESLALCKEMEEKTQIPSDLLGLGLVNLTEGKPEARENILGSLYLCQETASCCNRPLA